MNLIFTVSNRESLTNALILAESVHLYHPSDKFVMGWVDTHLPKNLPDYIEIIEIEKLAIPTFEKMCTHYFQYELLPATRPWFAKYLLNKYNNISHIIFLAPTVVLFSTFLEIINKESNFMVTPQISKPLPKDSLLKDAHILNTGMFHAGSWIAKPTSDVQQYLDWWCIRTEDRAYYDLCNGMCLDQLWLNYVPARIKSWHKLQNPSWHFGINKIPNYDLHKKESYIAVASERLISADFAGLTIFDRLWSDYDQLATKDTLFLGLLDDYRSKLKSLRSFQISGQSAYGKYVKISTIRNFRNKTAQRISAITEFIDNY